MEKKRKYIRPALTPQKPGWAGFFVFKDERQYGEIKGLRSLPPLDMQRAWIRVNNKRERKAKKMGLKVACPLFLLHGTDTNYIQLRPITLGRIL